MEGAATRRGNVGEAGGYALEGDEGETILFVAIRGVGTFGVSLATVGDWDSGAGVGGSSLGFWICGSGGAGFLRSEVGTSTNLAGTLTPFAWLLLEFSLTERGSVGNGIEVIRRGEVAAGDSLGCSKVGGSAACCRADMGAGSEGSLIFDVGVEGSGCCREEVGAPRRWGSGIRDTFGTCGSSDLGSSESEVVVGSPLSCESSGCGLFGEMEART